MIYNTYVMIKWVWHMNHYLVLGDMPGYADRFEVCANSKAEAESKVVGFGYTNVQAFDWNIQFHTL